MPQVGEASYAAKLGKDDLALDPNDPRSALQARVRPLAATSGARLDIDGQPPTVWRTRPADDAAELEPAACADAGRVLLGTGDGALELVEVQPAGRRRMDATAWARGLRGDLPFASRP